MKLTPTRDVTSTKFAGTISGEGVPAVCAELHTRHVPTIAVTRNPVESHRIGRRREAILLLSRVARSTKIPRHALAFLDGENAIDCR
jgi:hypothetical protein